MKVISDWPWCLWALLTTNTGKDEDEGVEIAGPAGLSLSGWSLQGYSGNLQAPHVVVNIPSAPLLDMQGGMGVMFVKM